MFHFDLEFLLAYSGDPGRRRLNLVCAVFLGYTEEHRAYMN